MLETPLSNKEKEFQWKVIDNAIFTEHKLNLMNMFDGLCHFCKENTENLRHLFYYCRRVNWIIHEIEIKVNHILEEDLQQRINSTPFHFILGFLHEKSYIRIFVNFIIILTKWEIWKHRNKIKHDNKQLSNHFIFNSVIQKIRTAESFLENTKVIHKFEKEFRIWKKIN